MTKQRINKSDTPYCEVAEPIIKSKRDLEEFMRHQRRLVQQFRSAKEMYPELPNLPEISDKNLGITIGRDGFVYIDTDVFLRKNNEMMRFNKAATDMITTHPSIMYQLVKCLYNAYISVKLKVL
jgi:hypothetical protein